MSNKKFAIFGKLVLENFSVDRAQQCTVDWLHISHLLNPRQRLNLLAPHGQRTICDVNLTKHLRVRVRSECYIYLALQFVSLYSARVDHFRSRRQADVNGKNHCSSGFDRLLVA